MSLISQAIEDFRQRNLTRTLDQVECRGPHDRGWVGPCGFCQAIR